MSKSVYDINEAAKLKNKTKGNTFDMFPVGKKVRVICVCQDFQFFRGDEEGIVVKNTGKYLGITIKLAKDFKWGFNPEDLVLLEDKPMNDIPELTQDQEIERVAMNIVFQIGDELFERGIITVDQRQETNDLFINFVKNCIKPLLHSQDIKSREDEIDDIITDLKKRFPYPAIKTTEQLIELLEKRKQTI